MDENQNEEGLPTEEPTTAPKPERVADRPHRLSLLIGILGPLATTLAVSVTGCLAYLSWETANRSVQVAEQNMKVGQRAYIVIENSQSSVLLIKARKESPGLPVQDSLVGAIEHSFKIKNLGRTPGSTRRLMIRFHLPNGWWKGADTRNRFRKDDGWWVYELPMAGDIPPEGALPFENAYLFSLSDDAVVSYRLFLEKGVVPPEHFPAFASAFPVAVVSVLEFTDVFGDSHTVTWEDRAVKHVRKDAAPKSR